MVDATVRGIHRGTIYSDANFHVEAHTVATAAEPEPTVERIETPVYNLVIEHPEGKILWDTGSHHEAGDGHWPEELYAAFEQPDAAEHRLAEDLAEAGFDLAEIDAVVCSHLHVDHAGGLHAFAGTDTPIYVHEAELRHAYYAAVTEGPGSGYLRADFDRDLNWQIVHRDRAQYFEDLEFVRLPGHAPGLLGVVIHLDDHGTLLLAGDAAELAVNYEEERPPGPGLVRNREAWFESLRTLQDLERRHDAEVVYGHDPEQLDAILEGWP